MAHRAEALAELHIGGMAKRHNRYETLCLGAEEQTGLTSRRCAELIAEHNKIMDMVSSMPNNTA
jgi:hypothetical protein